MSFLIDIEKTPLNGCRTTYYENALRGVVSLGSLLVLLLNREIKNDVKRKLRVITGLCVFLWSVVLHSCRWVVFFDTQKKRRLKISTSFSFVSSEKNKKQLEASEVWRNVFVKQQACLMKTENWLILTKNRSTHRRKTFEKILNFAFSRLKNRRFV